MKKMVKLKCGRFEMECEKEKAGEVQAAILEAFNKSGGVRLEIVFTPTEIAIRNDVTGVLVFTTSGFVREVGVK